MNKLQTFTPSPARPAPENTVGPAVWLKNNLFSTPLDTVATLLLGYILLTILPGVIDWLFLSANWTGDSQDACVNDGACWVFVSAWSQQFFYGSYPTDELWRVNLSIAMLVVIIAASYQFEKGVREKIIIPLFLLLPVISIAFWMGAIWGWSGSVLTCGVASH